MLEKIDLSKKMSRKDFKVAMEETDAKLGRLQRACRENKIPVVILFEGYGAAGKGTMISRLIEPLLEYPSRCRRHYRARPQLVPHPAA